MSLDDDTLEAGYQPSLVDQGWSTTSSSDVSIEHSERAYGLEAIETLVLVNSMTSLVQDYNQEVQTKHLEHERSSVHSSDSSLKVETFPVQGDSSLKVLPTSVCGGVTWDSLNRALLTQGLPAAEVLILCRFQILSG
jgi:hypothetical protein